MATLFYIIGASGVGKDALMQYARQAINGSRPVVFAHRYITRPREVGGENHIPMSVEEFGILRERGLFGLHWESHGFHYGIGKEIDGWMNGGLDVVVNGSRQYLPVARERYPRLRAIMIEADPLIIRGRLEGRGRETPEEVESRLARRTVAAEGIFSIRNEGALDEAGQELLHIINHHSL